MKLHIKIKNIEYNNYDPEDNYTKTICIIRWINPITKNIQRSVGVSRCNPNDTFDIIKGQRIAESRAKINMWTDYRFSVISCLDMVIARHAKFTIHEQNHIYDLINDNIKEQK